jgi:hypothetical protein
MFDWRELTVNAVVGYGVSWGYFFLSLGFFQERLGKIKGAFVNYWISWVVWIGTTYVLQVNDAREDAAATFT